MCVLLKLDINNKIINSTLQQQSPFYQGKYNNLPLSFCSITERMLSSPKEISPGFVALNEAIALNWCSCSAKSK